MKTSNRNIFPIVGITVIVPLLTVAALVFSNPLPFGEILNGSASETDVLIFNEVFLPRTLFIFLAGAAICLSGYLLQVLVQNPLADAYILGTANGASLGVNLSLLGILPAFVNKISLSPVWAMLIALATTVTVISLAQKKEGINVFILIIGGVAISSFTTALSSLLIYFSDSNDKIRNIIFWAFGSFDHIQWKDIPAIASLLFVSIVVLLYKSESLHLLIFGEQKAKDLGIKPERIKWMILVISSALTAYTVSICGPISFIGLIVPHFIRAIFGAIGRLNLIFAPLFGGMILLLCDSIARWAYPPVGLPIGIVTSIVGIPLFIYLLLKTKYRF